MLTNAIRVSGILLLSLVLFACGEQAPRMEIEMNVTLNGKLVPNAKVSMDGKLLGETGADGQFNTSVNQLPGKQLKVDVIAAVAGYDPAAFDCRFRV